MPTTSPQMQEERSIPCPIYKQRGPAGPYRKLRVRIHEAPRQERSQNFRGGGGAWRSPKGKLKLPLTNWGADPFSAMHSSTLSPSARFSVG